MIDDDQGKSGASAADRSGFRDLMPRIAAGEVGIVLSLEISRLARNNHDWSQLLQVARIADTLILDEAGVHDPGDSSDKLLLDIKGTISEFELEGIKARLIGGQRSKAARGELRIPLPIGLAYDEDGKVVLDGDRQIVEAIRLVFQAFRDKGSAMATAKWFRAEGLRAHSRFPGAVCRQRWTVRLGEVEPVFGQTGRVVLDITARTAHDGALKWTRAPSTPRAARSILATFPSTCALPSGGRWSLRRVLQRPGRQRKRSSAKSSRFHTDWKETKLLILYVVGDDGRPSQTWAPIIDGTLRGPEAVFALLLSYARQIGLNAADKVLFIADGAPWIWRRLQRLIAALGLSPTQVLGLIDFYTALRELCRGRTAGKIRTHLNYFLKNRHRFAYTTMVGFGLPRGSGAVESAIRRVINLRIKGASIYWLPESVDAILLLRSFYKSGRWNCLQRMAMTPVGVSA